MLRVSAYSLFAASLLALTACQSTGYRAVAQRPEASAGYLGGGDKGDVVSLDDVTSGLVDNSSQGLAGAFFNDGHSGDVRARTESYYAKDIGRVRSGKQDGVPGQDPAPAASPRLLIQKGLIRVEVARAEDAGKAFLEKVEQWGGYLQRQSGTTWTVRVPAEHFDDAFAAARSAGRVLGESREANDVTEEFVDLGIRVDNARRSRDRLLEILAKAEKVEEILAVERELRRLTEEIERMEGRLKFLKDQVAMSTLSADFVAIAVVEPKPQPKRRQWSRFDWINRVGPKAVLEGF